MRIDFYAEPGATPEKLLVEVQGTIHPPVDPIGKSVFFLYWQSPTTAICLIDHHMMEGSLKTLEQPYLVVDTKSTTKQSEGMYKCRIAFVIRKKMSFKSRPKPIMC